MKKIFAISLIAMTAVTTANAEIASKAYVDTTREAVANKVNKTENLVEADYTTTGYPSMATAKAIAEAVSGGANYVPTSRTVNGHALTDNVAVTLSDLSVTATAAEINKLAGNEVTAADLTKLHAVTADATELNYVDGVTSNIQTQLDAKLDANTAIEASTANSIVQYDADGLVISGTPAGTMATANTADYYNKTDIGTIESGKTLVQMISDASATSNFIEDQVTDGTTNKAPSSNAVYDQLALKENVISATNKVDVAFIDETNYATSGLKTTLDAAYDAKNAATTALGGLDMAEVGGSGNVILTVSQSDGQVAATAGKIANANVADNAAIDMGKIAMPTTIADGTTIEYGTYGLTADVGANGITYKWELIQRAGN